MTVQSRDGHQAIPAYVLGCLGSSMPWPSMVLNACSKAARDHRLLSSFSCGEVSCGLMVEIEVA
jgi:uncharacterized UBP type Zn finger protein